MKKNTIELSQQLFKHAGTSAYGGSSLLMTAIQQRTATSSFDRPLYKNMSLASSYLPPQLSSNVYSQVPPTFFSHSMTNQNNFCQHYMMNPHAGQSGTQHQILTKNSYMMKESTQVLSYQCFAPSSSHLDSDAQSCSQNPRISGGESDLNSDCQRGQAFDHQTVDMFVSENLLDSYSIELDAILACK